MSLKIENEDTCRLVSELAELTGETKTGAIAVAVRERLERERRNQESDTKLREMRVIAERCAALVGSGASSLEHGEELYDDYGLPH